MFQRVSRIVYLFYLFIQNIMLSILLLCDVLPQVDAWRRNFGEGNPSRGHRQNGEENASENVVCTSVDFV
jgi:hypothetical protein